MDQQMILPDLARAADEFAESVQPATGSYKSALLLPLADYSAPISLRKLKQATKNAIPVPLRGLKLVPGILMDEKELNWVFKTDKWRVTQESVKALINAMPAGVVSPKTNRVAVWGRLDRALERQPTRVAAYDSKAFFVVEGTSEPYLVTIDFLKKLFASSCPEHNSTDRNARRRWEICKHIAAALIYYRSEVFSRSKLPTGELKDWEAAFARAQSASQDILSNYHYYYIKKFVPLLGFKAAYYADRRVIDQAIRCVLSSP